MANGRYRLSSAAKRVLFLFLLKHTYRFPLGKYGGKCHFFTPRTTLPPLLTAPCSTTKPLSVATHTRAWNGFLLQSIFLHYCLICNMYMKIAFLRAGRIGRLPSWNANHAGRCRRRRRRCPTATTLKAERHSIHTWRWSGALGVVNFARVR